MQICSQFQGLQKVEGGYLVSTNNAQIKIVFLTEEIVRVRASFDKAFKEASYALALTAWEDRLDFLFEGERTRVEPLEAKLSEDEKTVVFEAGKLKLVLDKDPIAFKLYNESGELIYSDIAGNPFVKDSNNRVFHYNQISPQDCFYGFGEKTGEINKAKSYMRMAPKDAMGYDAIHTDPLYKHIPFYIKLNPTSQKAVGLYYHNTYECAFCMGQEKSNYWPSYSYYVADGGDIDLFLIGGDQISKVVENYTTLTGKSALLPKHALGYLGSSMYYPELAKDCDDAIEGFVDTNKEEEMPIDGFQLSSGYTSLNNKRYVFTWNTDRFKNPEQFFENMKAKGVQVTPNVKPGILLTHPYFNDFNREGLFVKDSEGNGYGVGKWWGGDGAFVDFTNPHSRAVWQNYLTEHVIAKGTDCIWNDNCEYDGLMDKDCVCEYDGGQGTIGQLKAIMPNMMCKVTTKSILDHNENARPYIVCRSGYSGIQRYAQTWAGDNNTSWDSLKYNIATVLGMGISGVANQGCDIGGFYGVAPEAELFVRWVQNGIFQPRFSIHSVNIDNTVTEPWMYSGHKGYIRDAIKLRYKMMPYLYSLMYGAHKLGTPIMRPMFYEFQNDANCYNEGVDFMYGEALLVANVVDKGAKTRAVYLPAATNWYDYATRTFYKGGQTIEVPVEIDSIPMFIREGSILPLASHQIMNVQQEDIRGLHLIVSPKGESSFTLYEDDGITNNYKKGDYLETIVHVADGEKVKMNFTNQGNYETKVEEMLLDVISKDKGPFWVSVEGKEIEHFLQRSKFEAAEEGWYYSQTLKSVLVKYKNPKIDHEVIVSFEHFDMIGM